MTNEHPDDWREVVEHELFHAMSLLESLGFSTEDDELFNILDEDQDGPLIYAFALMALLGRSILDSVGDGDINHALDCMMHSRHVKTIIPLLDGDPDLSFSEAFEVARSKLSDLANTTASDTKSRKLAWKYFQNEIVSEVPSRELADAALQPEGATLVDRERDRRRAHPAGQQHPEQDHPIPSPAVQLALHSAIGTRKW